MDICGEGERESGVLRLLRELGTDNTVHGGPKAGPWDSEVSPQRARHSGVLSRW